MKTNSIRILSEEESKQLKYEQNKNVNIGIMGHIDSGKTSITKILSTIASTASLDRNPISKEKGITIDIGFSCFSVELLSAKLQKKHVQKYIQFTIVDCPGHASFIKSVIAGASIIDLMVLVIDINKGIQIQTAECLAIGEIMGLNILIVLNKIDKLEKDSKKIQKMTKQLQKLIGRSKYPNRKQVQIIPFSCNLEEQVHELRSNLINALIISLGEVK